MGRKAKELTDEQRAQVEALAAYLSQEQIADFLGIGKTTWYAMLERDPDISERYKRGKAKAIVSIAQGLLKKARDGDTTSAIFYLKTQANWRETQKLEHSGADGAPLSISVKYRD
jgi:IS30 family transposase